MLRQIDTHTSVPRATIFDPLFKRQKPIVLLELRQNLLIENWWTFRGYLQAPLEIDTRHGGWCGTIIIEKLGQRGPSGSPVSGWAHPLKIISVDFSTTTFSIQVVLNMSNNYGCFQFAQP